MSYSHPELDSGSHNISSLSLQNEIPDQVRNDERTNDYKYQIIISTLSSWQAVETEKSKTKKTIILNINLNFRIDSITTES